MSKENENETTTIVISRKTHSALSERKVHPNQSFDEVIQQLLTDTQPQVAIAKEA